ncbi:TPR Domain containing protein [Tritrichomonas foetus]|uniref:TPR Domain containing protein n=1 Tax=Tritrichomonas foetus TaxID=1144522 RepID=A0A1J4KZK3_9EUKA|nr:TPR Domain containing protein [Tritrichomonas foetus]|eukprot:OHT16586.1 TPR Domain containing protein [Tritrichomonas foetus]
MCETEWKEALKSSFEQCHWKSALFYSEKILHLYPSNFEALFCRAFSFLCTQQFAELEQWMMTLPDDIAKNEKLLFIRCKALQSTKNYAKIVSILGGYADTVSLVIPVVSLDDVTNSDLLRPIRENALFNLSHTDYLPKDEKKNENIPNDPLNPQKVVNSIIQAMMNQDPEFVEPYSIMTDKTTESDPLILTACACYSLLNEHAEAGEALLMKATEENPDCEIAWLCLISSFINSAEWDQGLSTLRKVIRRFPTSSSVSMFALSLHLKSGTSSLAWPWIQQSDESSLFVKHERGVALLMDGDIAQAAHDFKAVIENSKERDLIGAANLNLGHCYRKLGDFNRAIECYEEALTFGTRPAESLASIGFSYHLKGNKDEAILYYNRCLSIDSVHPFATKMLDIAVQQM